jgi:hypothetical protein
MEKEIREVIVHLKTRGGLMSREVDVIFPLDFEWKHSWLSFTFHMLKIKISNTKTN